MATLRLTVETITPLLMFGADQREPELRGSAFRGQLRYWLRAVLGAEHTSSPALYEAESQIMGSTETGSKVVVRVQASRSMHPDYPLYVMPRETRGRPLKQDGFEPGGEFRIILSTHPLDASGVLDAESPLVKAIFLLAHVGGLGRRARRGSGNLRIIEARGYKGELPLAPQLDDRDHLREYLVALCEFIGTRTIGHRPRFATFAPDTTVVLLGNTTYTTHEDAFADLWSTSGPYHDAHGIFGAIRPRRASAIHMRLHVTQAGYVPMQTIFYADNGAWDEMRDYIQHCRGEGYEQVYGDAGGWS